MSRPLELDVNCFRNDKRRVRTDDDVGMEFRDDKELGEGMGNKNKVEVKAEKSV